MDHFDVCVIGAGVVGLAIARELAMRSGKPDAVLLLEQHAAPAQETSSRSSEVIHAGIYYPPDSLKARLCIEGRERLYHYCEQFDVPYRRCGKLIVAGDGELPQLEALADNAARSGAGNLLLLDQQALRRAEPLVAGRHALFSPDSGIVDSHVLMQRLLAQAEASGLRFAALSRVEHIHPASSGFIVEALCGAPGSQEVYRFSCRQLINSAGLHAQVLARRIEGLEPALIPPLHLCKGTYFSLSGRSPFSHLIYPLPEKNAVGLGVHATLDLSGRVRFGPDAEYVDSLDYRPDPAAHQRFCEAIRRYYPELDADALHADYSGIRPKLQGPGDTFKDFVVQDQSSHGIAGLIQLFGIESPGLTAALALASEVSRLS